MPCAVMNVANSPKRMPTSHPAPDRTSLASLPSLTFSEMLPTTEKTMAAMNAGTMTLCTTLMTVPESTAMKG